MNLQDYYNEYIAANVPTGMSVWDPAYAAYHTAANEYILAKQVEERNTLLAASASASAPVSAPAPASAPVSAQHPLSKITADDISSGRYIPYLADQTNPFTTKAGEYSTLYENNPYLLKEVADYYTNLSNAYNNNKVPYANTIGDYWEPSADKSSTSFPDYVSLGSELDAFPAYSYLPYEAATDFLARDNNGDGTYDSWLNPTGLLDLIKNGKDLPLAYMNPEQFLGSNTGWEGLEHPELGYLFPISKTFDNEVLNNGNILSLSNRPFETNYTGSKGGDNLLLDSNWVPTGNSSIIDAVFNTRLEDDNNPNTVPVTQEMLDDFRNRVDFIATGGSQSGGDYNYSQRYLDVDRNQNLPQNSIIDSGGNTWYEQGSNNSWIGGVLGVLSLMFPVLAPLAAGYNIASGVINENPLQVIGGAVGLSGTGSLGSLGDATQLANQGLGFSQIADTLGYTGLGGLGANLAAGYGTLAGLGSGALDSLGVGDALSGLTNGSLSPDYINATLGNSATMGGIQGAANGDIGTGVLAGLASPVVGYGVGQVANELEVPKNTVTNGALSGLSGGITNNVVGGNADILNSVVGGVANNVIGSTLKSGWNLLKDTLPEFTMDDVGYDPSVYGGSTIDTGYDGDFVGPQQDLEWQQASDIFDLTNGEDPYGTTWNAGNFDGSWSSLENDNGVQTFPYTQPVVAENVQTFPYNPPEITESQIDPSNLDETMADDWLYGDHNQPIIDDIYAPIDEGDDLSFDTLDPINVTENYEPFDGPVYGDIDSDPTWDQEADIFDLTDGQMESTSTGDWNLGDILNSDPTWDQEADIFDLTDGLMESPSTGDWNFGDTDMGFFDNDPTWQQEADIFDLTNGQMENPLTGQWDFTDYGDPTWDQEVDIFDLTNGEMENPSTGDWDFGNTSGSTSTGSFLDWLKKKVQDTLGTSSTSTNSGGTGTSNSALMGMLLLALLSRQQASSANGISEDALNYVAGRGEGGSPRTTGAQFGIPKTAVGTLSQLTNVTPTVGGKFDLGMRRN